jgi:hypothetical protein
MLSTLMSYVGLGASSPGVDVASVEVFDVETAADKTGRRLKHLLKLNHSEHSILYNKRRFHNHSPHILGSAYLLKASADHLTNIYEDISKHDNLDQWEDSPSEIAEHDHRDFLGKKEYQRAWVDFFEDQLVEAGYDWKAVVTKYLFETGPKSSDSLYAMFDCLVSGLGHPLIHLGYAYELNSREVAMEALGLAATCYDTQLASLATTPPPKHIPEPTSDLFTLFNRVGTDSTFDNIFTAPGGSNLSTLLATPKLTAALLGHFHSYTITDATKSFAQSQRLASLLLISTSKHFPQPGHDYDFFLVHLLTTSHAIRILLPFLPKHTHMRLIKQWLLITLAIYIAQLRPSLSQAAEAQKAFDLKGRGWEFVTEKALHGEHKYDAHFVKGCRAMLAGAKAWGDEDGFFLRNAVRFADEFEGWGGFGSEDLEEMEEASQGHR